MKKNYFESILGFFTLMISLVFLMKFVNVNTDNNETYQLKAKFLKAGGISPGNDVKMRGVKIGVVNQVYLDENFFAVVDFKIYTNISVPIEPPTGKVLEYSHNEFNFNQSIQKIDERIISEIPVKILNKDSEMRIFTSPQTVSLTVVGGAEYISSIKPSELEVSVDFNNWRKDKQFYEIRVKAPNDVIDWMDLSPMSIELIVSQKNN